MVMFCHMSTLNWYHYFDEFISTGFLFSFFKNFEIVMSHYSEQPVNGGVVWYT